MTTLTITRQVRQYFTYMCGSMPITPPARRSSRQSFHQSKQTNRIQTAAARGRPERVTTPQTPTTHTKPNHRVDPHRVYITPHPHTVHRLQTAAARGGPERVPHAARGRGGHLLLLHRRCVLLVCVDCGMTGLIGVGRCVSVGRVSVGRGKGICFVFIRGLLSPHRRCVAVTDRIEKDWRLG